MASRPPEPKAPPSIPLPDPDASGVTNAIVVVCLVGFCVALSYLTDWRWGLLVGSALGVVAAVYVQRNMPADVEKKAAGPGRRTG